MAHTAPTSQQFLNRFPEFVEVNDVTVDAFIAEALREVDSSWTEGDYATAIMYLVAHMMATEGHLASAGGPLATSGPVSSEKLGDASVSYASRSASGAAFDEADLQSTAYGLRFLTLRKRNVATVVAV